MRIVNASSPTNSLSARPAQIAPATVPPASFTTAAAASRWPPDDSTSSINTDRRSGCWSRRDLESSVEKVWIACAAGVMSGRLWRTPSKDVSDDRLSFESSSQSGGHDHRSRLRAFRQSATAVGDWHERDIADRLPLDPSGNHFGEPVRGL
jgi:hypothetical protein